MAGATVAVLTAAVQPLVVADEFGEGLLEQRDPELLAVGLREDGRGRALVHGDQVVDRHGQGRVVAEHGVARRVSDEQEVDAGLVEDLGGEHVVGREARDLDALLLRPGEVTGADSLR